MGKVYQIFITIILLLFISFLSFSQKTIIYTHPDKDYHKGLELFNKQKYGAAQKVFNDIYNTYNEEMSDIKTDAQYFSAICAIELFNKDAEYLISKFIKQHPESPRVKTAYYQMGRFQFRKGKFKKVLKWFDLVNPYDLKNEELAEYHFKKGYSNFMLEQFDEASTAFKEIKDAKTKYTIPAIYYYAHIAYLNKNHETALQEFLRLKDNELFAPIVPYYITQIMYYQGKYNEIIKYAPPLLDSASTKRAPEIARVIAESYYRNENYKKSIKYFEIFKNKTKTFNREDIYQIGYAYYKAENYQKAIVNFEAVINTKDSIAQSAYYHLADCYLKDGIKEKARMAFASASKLNFDGNIQEDAMFNYAKLTYEITYSPFNDAIKAFEKYLNEYPSSDKQDEAYKYLSEAYLTTKNYKGAIESLENIRDITDDIEKAYQKVCFYRGLELFNDADYSNAIIHFDKSLNNSKYNQLFKAQSIFWKGECYYQSNRYKEANKYYNEFVLTGGSYGLKIYNTAHYNLGYGYFKEKNYNEAISWFRKYVDRMKGATIKPVGDAYNRIGDCYYVQSEYEKAIDYYNNAIENGSLSIDYARYQKGFCHGLLKEHNQKIIELTQLISEFSNSPYVDDGLYEIGNAYVDIESGDMALVYYEQLMNEHPKSRYVKNALLKMGMIYYNSNDYDLAKTYYKKVITEYPKSNELDLALTYLKEIHVEENTVDDYLEYRKSLVDIADISVVEEDSLTYIAAEKLYMADDCEKSKIQFEKYINKFSNGNYIINAHFYFAECQYKSGNEDQALNSYNYIIERLNNIFTEHALVRASSINFKKGNYNDALSNYSKLEEIAEYKNNILMARIGKMRSYYKLENYPEAKKAAISVLSKEKLADNIFREAHFIIGKFFYHNNQMDNALDEFTIISQNCKTSEGAESKYLLAKIYTDQKEYDLAKEEIFDFNKKGTPHQIWLAKSIILLADIYYLNGENFQAKHTLYSIIDNYDNDNDGILNSANLKLEEIMENEEEERQLDEALEDIIKFGEEYEELFNE